MTTESPNKGSYFPLHAHCQYSLLDGLPHAKKMAARIVELDLPGCALSDHGNLFGAVEFIEAMEKVNKKWILACEVYCKDNVAEEKKDEKTSHLVILSKNLAGWKSLVKIVSDSNHKENFYYKPRTSLDKIKEFNPGHNLIAFSGHPGSRLANCLFKPELLSLIYNTDYTYDIIKKALREDWEAIAQEEIEKFQDAFGVSNFFIEIQLIDKDRLPCEVVIAECLRHMSTKLGVKKVATPDAHYPKKEDAIDQRVLLCCALQTTLPEVEKKLKSNDDVALGGFFKSDNYHIPSFEEMRVLHTDDELENTHLIAGMCEDYSIFSKPKLPKFTTPNGQSSIDYLKELCRDGWKRLIQNKIPKSKHKEYADRVKVEFEVLEEAGLADYFLIVWDILRYVREKHWLPGVGRGSVGGSLVAYLTRITQVDSIKHDLLFQRFYNNGRNVPNHVSFSCLSLSKFEELPGEHPIEDLSYVKERFEQEKNNAHFQAELATLQSKRVARYYTHLIKNCEADPENAANSYIMWACGRTDKIAPFLPAQIKMGKTSMPDIDIDVPAHVREDVIQYIREKYGESRVCQIVTFQSMKGRRALKDVFRVHGGVPADLMNEMTRPIPDEAKIADELQEMKEEEGFSSIIQWSLENKAKELEEYAVLKDGEISGMFGKRFEQAIRLEGTKTNQSKHAAGILISSEDLDEVCPLCYDKSSGGLIAGMEMNSLEKIGLIKFDVLGVSVLTKLMTIQEILSEDS